jgi:hypothetical protein
VLLLLSEEEIDSQPHVATAIHLENPPEYSSPNHQICSFIYDGELYYYAETTQANWTVGNIPSKFKDLTFYQTLI